MKPEFSPGTLIHNQYRIQRILGQGGLGRTYLSLDTHSFEERRVLKEFAPHGISSQSLQKAKDLFYREAQLLYQIKHPQIPKFFAYFEEDERLLLVQEYIEGETYAELLHNRFIQQQVFSEAEVLRLLRNLLPVLSDIHAQGIIHRDISIDNIMLSNHIPFLIDFGVGTQESAGKSFVGKFGYAPHEQLQLGQCSPSSDLYALAVTAIVLLTGHQPHQLTERLTSAEFWRSRATVSDRFAQIIQRMLAFYPGDRYAAATEVLTALQAIQTPLTTTAIQRSTPANEGNLVTTFPSLPGGAIASRPLHFIWICDCSNSMSVDGKIQALNTAIEEVIPHMRIAAADNPNAKVLVRAVKFSTGASWCVAEATSIDLFRWTDLEAEGITDLGAALHLVAEALQISRMSNRALPPVLVLISDGQPTDDYISGLKALLDQPWGKKAIRVAISIGRDADQDVLQQFIGHPDLRPLRANNPEALIRQIRWASTAVMKAASAPASAITSVLPMMTSVPTSGFEDVW
ncbi:MAG: protein kinase [Leptolyngbya sp. Prado105]|jgi:serine/threonine protein kinase|nr:protein kinase [Leptolyngbya sp. Prado105]